MKQALRIFPTLTILNNDLVKTVNYKNPRYLGDPINAIKLFNNKNVDEISILDITSRFNKNVREINYVLLKEMAQEAFLPLSYGGNIDSAETADKIIKLGFEKVIINSLLFENPNELEKIVSKLGSQSVVLKLDYTLRNGGLFVFYNQQNKNKEFTIDEIVTLINHSRVGEVILSRTDYDGIMKGYDLEFTKYVLERVQIPLVLAHGANNKQSIEDASEIGFSNFTASSMFVFIGKLKAVLINNPLL
jgi:cyclase